jgi:glycosyltransferase involved in cell wall biosynthesis
MNHCPTISVIIPCYNGAGFLSEAIESVLAQRYPDLETIVVDDGSTDNSLAIAAQYPEIRSISQRNAGVAAARNTGLRYSAGEYIVFLDQDDRLLPDALESNLNCLLAHSSCAFGFGDAQFIDAAGTPLSESACAALGVPQRTSSPHEGTQHYISLLRGNYILTPGVIMHRRRILEVLSGFDPRFGPATDFDLNLRIARSHPICHNNTLVLQKRLHLGNHSRNYAASLRYTITMLREQKRWAKRNGYYATVRRMNAHWYEDVAGKSLLKQILTDIRLHRDWGITWTGTLALLRYAPLLPARCVWRQARGLLANRP